jgi:hypothetical protein
MISMQWGQRRVAEENGPEKPLFFARGYYINEIVDLKMVCHPDEGRNSALLRPFVKIRPRVSFRAPAIGLSLSCEG